MVHDLTAEQSWSAEAMKHLAENLIVLLLHMCRNFGKLSTVL
jgi:hypothetical protein